MATESEFNSSSGLFRRCFKTWSILPSQFPSGSAIILLNSFLSAALQRDSKERM